MNINHTSALISFKGEVREIKKPSPKSQIPGMLISFDQQVAMYHTQSADLCLKLSQSMSMRSPVTVTVNNITGEITAVKSVL